MLLNSVRISENSSSVSVQTLSMVFLFYGVPTFSSFQSITKIPKKKFIFQYPVVSPKIDLRQPRGLNEDNLNTLWSNIERYTERNIGMPVLFDVFQVRKELFKIVVLIMD